MRNTVWFNEQELAQMAIECGLDETKVNKFLDFVDNPNNWINYCVEQFNDHESDHK